jgi:hypothetical protein
MRKKLLSFAAVILTSGVLVFTGCKKDDATAPVVTLNGAESVTIALNSSYTELGATATDDKDGAIVPTVTGTVNKDLVGTYTITYSATDAAGNEGTATRTVIVRNEADIYAGTYNCEDTDFGALSPWKQVVGVSATENNVITFDKFAARTGNTIVTAKYTPGTKTFTVISTTVPNLGANGCTFKYTPNGPGAAVTVISGKAIFSLKYYEEKLAGGTNCAAIAPAAFEDKFTQQ